MHRALAALPICLALASLIACAPSAADPDETLGPPAPPDFVLAGDAAAGGPLYGKFCATCHGANGDGNGSIPVQPKPRDLRDPAWGDSRTDWQIYVVIRDGGPALDMSPQMLAWGRTITDQEVRDISAYVRSLSAER